MGHQAVQEELDQLAAQETEVLRETQDLQALLVNQDSRDPRGRLDRQESEDFKVQPEQLENPDLEDQLVIVVHLASKAFVALQALQALQDLLVRQAKGAQLAQRVHLDKMERLVLLDFQAL
jgi:hypothetical protein